MGASAAPWPSTFLPGLSPSAGSLNPEDIAPYWQAGLQARQRMQSGELGSSEMSMSTGHTSRHFPHPVHFSSSTAMR